MKRLISILSLAALWQAGASWAQLAPYNEMGVTWGHLHLIVQDRDKETKSWLALGGQLGNNLSGNVPISFPGMLILILEGKPSGGSAGSVVDHVAFRVPDLQASITKWKAANWGLKIEPGTYLSLPGPISGLGIVTTPAQVKIEILEDKTLKVPIVFDHAHFFVVESRLKEAGAWYANMFGAKPVKGEQDTYSLPGGKLVFSKADTPAASPTGRSLDHIGFDVAGSHEGLAAFSKTLEAKGAKFSAPYRRSEFGNARPMDPFGVVVELTHGQDGYIDYKQIEQEMLPCENRPVKCR